MNKETTDLIVTVMTSLAPVAVAGAAYFAAVFKKRLESIEKKTDDVNAAVTHVNNKVRRVEDAVTIVVTNTDGLTAKLVQATAEASRALGNVEGRDEQTVEQGGTPPARTATTPG